MRKLYTILFFFSISISIFGNAIFPGGEEGTSENNTIEGLFDFSDADLNIYPNPVKNYATIGYTIGVDRIVIMNIVGKEVRSFIPDPDTKETKVNLTELQPGVYFIAAYSNGIKLITKRFMKEQ
ncbi:MAG: T9SS type A sorting domain-containing protein [Fimbriimonadaceae bacterium]|nr:T9SS type A sorting domain-containing protein [Chitinophagales bacterium]